MRMDGCVYIDPIKGCWELVCALLALLSIQVAGFVGMANVCETAARIASG